MAQTGHRHERVAEEIRQEMSAMVAGELKDPRIAGLVTVTEVRVSPDLRSARIFVSVLGTESERASTLNGLTAAAGFIRHELAERLQMRRCPELHFVLDQAGETADRIEQLLREAKHSTES